MSKLKIAVILGSTRDSRFGTKPAQWILDLAKQRPELDVELVDLKDYNLPLFNEVASNAWAPSQSQEAVRWQNKISEFDGYIFVTAEYNRSITGSLKNALDQAYVNWNKKAAGYVGYGTVGGARAIEHLRNIAVELQMASTRSAVHIGGSDFFTVWGGGANQPISAIEQNILPSAKDMLDQLTFWASAAKWARQEEQTAAAAE